MRENSKLTITALLIAALLTLPACTSTSSLTNGSDFAHADFSGGQSQYMVYVPQTTGRSIISTLSF